MSVVWTVAFAVLGVALGAGTGFLLALVFARLRAVRLLCAFLRSVHELFWALLLIQIAGLSPTTGILAVAIPYSGIFAKVFAEMIEEADLSAERVLPAGTSTIARFAYARIPSWRRNSGHTRCTGWNAACARPWCWALSACPPSAFISIPSSSRATTGRPLRCCSCSTF
jgi:ABC-type phosphate/phosphonate transport system permease subunit